MKPFALIAMAVMLSACMSQGAREASGGRAFAQLLDLSREYVQAGDVLLENGDIAGALAHYEAGLFLDKANTALKTKVRDTQKMQSRLAEQRLGRAAAKDELKATPYQRKISYLRVLAIDPNNLQALSALRRIDQSSARSAMASANRKIATAAAGGKEASGASAPKSAQPAAPENQIEQKEANNDPIDDPSSNEAAAARFESARSAVIDGQALEAQDRLEAAFAAYSTAADYDTALAKPHLERVGAALAEQYHKAGVKTLTEDLDAAIAAFKKALYFAPGHRRALKDLASARRLKDLTQDAY